jgi:hypothetical protein
MHVPSEISVSESGKLIDTNPDIAKASGPRYVSVEGNDKNLRSSQNAKAHSPMCFNAFDITTPVSARQCANAAFPICTTESGITMLRRDPSHENAFAPMCVIDVESTISVVYIRDHDIHSPPGTRVPI